MKQWYLILVLGLSSSLWAEEQSWSGIVKQEPSEDRGQWYIGTRNVTIGDDTERNYKVGPFDVGACAALSMEGEAVTKVETRAMSLCDNTDYEAYFAQFRIGDSSGS